MNLIKLLAANDKFKFWISLYALVDVFTIPPSFVTVITRLDWLGIILFYFILVVLFICFIHIEIES